MRLARAKLEPRQYRINRVVRELGELLGSKEVAKNCKAVAARFVGTDPIGADVRLDREYYRGGGTALRTLSPVLRGEGRVRGQRVAIWRGSQVDAFVPSPQPSPLSTGERENDAFCVFGGAAGHDTA